MQNRLSAAEAAAAAADQRRTLRMGGGVSGACRVEFIPR